MIGRGIDLWPDWHAALMQWLGLVALASATCWTLWLAYLLWKEHDDEDDV